MEMHSILMIGQSNMAGRGDFGEVEPIQDDRIKMLRCGLWRKMEEPVNVDQKLSVEGDPLKLHSGISLAASFAKRYAEYFSCEVGLVPCAFGGTYLSQWMPGEILYDHAVFQAKLAMRTSKLTAILWHQGESDCESMDLVERYEEKFHTMMDQMKKDLGMPDIPVIIGEIGYYLGEYENGKYSIFPELNKRLHKIAMDRDDCQIASAAGLTSRPDLLHFDSLSLRELGDRYFNAFLSVHDKP